MKTLTVTMNESTFGIALNGKTLLSHRHDMSLEPRLLEFDKYGQQLKPFGNGEYLNPAHFFDRRKPARIPAESVVVRRYELPLEIAERLVAHVSRTIVADNMAFRSSVDGDRAIAEATIANLQKA